MSRRHRAGKRKVPPDPKYHSVMVTKFVNKLMLNGKKSLARRIFYEAIEAFAKEVNEDNPVIALETALEHAMPLLEVKSRRLGGATYQVPMEIPSERRLSMAVGWIIRHARKKVGRNMREGLTMEFVDCFRNQGATIKTKEDTHRMAEANKAFAHYKW